MRLSRLTRYGNQFRHCVYKSYCRADKINLFDFPRWNVKREKQIGFRKSNTTMRHKRIVFQILVLGLVGTCTLFITFGLLTFFKYSYVSVQMAVEGLQPDNEALLRYVRNKYLVPPSTKPYNMSAELIDPSMGQAAAVFKILNQKRNGFFVECGAFDGEIRSNTYWLERELGWGGILIEANPENFKLLLTKHRKVFAVPACLSTYVHSMSFHPYFTVGKIVQEVADGVISVQCLPLWTVMLAVNQTKTIDYFSLDVEGHELEVLRAIPFDLLDIRVMSVEWKHVPEGKEFLRQYVESKGYVMVKEVTARNNLANDFIFVKTEHLRIKINNV